MIYFETLKNNLCSLTQMFCACVCYGFFFPEPDYSTIILTLVDQVLYFYLSASTVDVLLSHKPTLYLSASTVDDLLGTNPITLTRLPSTSCQVLIILTYLFLLRSINDRQTSANVLQMLFISAEFSSSSQRISTSKKKYTCFI